MMFPRLETPIQMEEGTATRSGPAVTQEGS